MQMNINRVSGSENFTNYNSTWQEVVGRTKGKAVEWAGGKQTI